jgi:hypothetical protein
MMGKYQQSNHMMPSKPKPTQVHPIWRGIGCILILISPLIAYAAATLIVQWNIDNGWYPLPAELLTPFNFEPLNITQDHFFANLLVAGLLLLLGFAMVMVVYSIMYAIFGPRRYSPIDAPPVRRK